jgi:hypothetical protein
MDMSAPGAGGAYAFMMSRRSGLRQGFLFGLTQIVGTGIDERAAAFAAFVEVCATLIHFTKLLSHQANDFKTEHWLSSQEFLECRCLDEGERAIALAAGSEHVRRRTQDRRQSDDTPWAEETLEDFLIFVCNDDRETYKAAPDNIDTAAGCALHHDVLLRSPTRRRGQRLQGSQELWRELERATTFYIT